METNPALRAAARRSQSLPDEVLLRECTEEFFTAGGPGGQHRNKTESAVRLTHHPTGVVIWFSTSRTSGSGSRHR